MSLPTHSQSKRALKLLRQNVSMPRVIAAIGGGFTDSDITAGIDAMRTDRNAKRPRRTGWQMLESMRSVITIPDHVIADRKRRLTLQPSDTTAFLMRDPLPGYSAGEREREAATTITRDPLDGLMFRRRKTGARYG